MQSHRTLLCLLKGMWEKKSQEKKSQKKSHKHFFLLYVRNLWTLFYFLFISNSFKNIFVGGMGVDVLHPDYQFSVMPGWS